MGEEDILLRMEVLGIGRQEAEFIDAIETGEIDGDVIRLDESGKEIRQPEPEPPQ